MSRIKDARVFRRPLPMVRSFATAVQAAGSGEAILVAAVDSEGRSGRGEAAGSGIEGPAVSDD
jgi:hypothetical protein